MTVKTNTDGRVLPTTHFGCTCSPRRSSFMALSDLPSPAKPKSCLIFCEGDAIIVLVALGVVTLVGLAINRRALIVSSLFYAGAAIAFLVRQTGMDFGSTLSLTLILLGAAIVLLGVAWHPARNQLIKLLPNWRVFPPRYEPLQT
jgi:hypothetical protein